MVFDNPYFGKLSLRKKGRGAKNEVLKASLYVVAYAALSPLLAVSFYP
ncbi:MAG: hypothetical protein M3R38_02620 [Actinomycetota bacterium]|nr:hypothetical protein [Actinomycetota bacterium]